MSNILIISGHPDFNNSFANKIIWNELPKHLPQATYHRLDKNYPDFKIDVAREQQRLTEADVIVLQFPLFWYGVPALMKKWIEDVFVHGFSHGSTGDKVRGKKFVVSFTSGAPEELYRHGGLQHYEIEEFLPPLKQFANLCGMEWAGFVYSGGLSYASRQDEEKLKQMEVKAKAHAEKLAAHINQL